MLAGIDSLGLMMLAIMILVFGPLATVQSPTLTALAFPLVLVFVFGVLGIAGFSALVGKLSATASRCRSPSGSPRSTGSRHDDPVPGGREGCGREPEEIAAIEHEILPKMIVAGFSTVTITSVIVTSIIAGRIGGG